MYTIINTRENNMSAIVDFYSEKPDHTGRSIEDIWKYSYKELEHTHDYIQYLFPIIEPSYFNRSTPKLLISDISQFKNNKSLRHNLLISFLIMLDFYGLSCDLNNSNILIYKGENYEERKGNWQTGKNHNFLRITRILISLKTLGLENVSLAFYKCLIKLVEENPIGFNFTSLEYWKDAVKELLLDAVD